MPGVSGFLLRFEVKAKLRYLQIASGIYKSAPWVPTTSIMLTSIKFYFPKKRRVPSYCLRWRAIVRDVCVTCGIIRRIDIDDGTEAWT